MIGKNTLKDLAQLKDQRNCLQTSIFIQVQITEGYNYAFVLLIVKLDTVGYMV